MELQDVVLVYSTFPDQQIANEIAREIVELKLAACANIFDGMHAIYEWKGEMQSDKEVAVLFKTAQPLQDELSRKLHALHPYDTPAIIGVEASHVEASYLAWLHGQLKM